jgi:hypothetical protein
MKVEKRLTPVKAIRAKCLDCCCSQAKEVRMCPVKKCPLYPYRMGKNPARKKGIEQQESEKKSSVEPGIFPLKRVSQT